MFYIVITESQNFKQGSVVEVFEKLEDAKKVANTLRKNGQKVRTLIKKDRICIYSKNKLL